MNKELSNIIEASLSFAEPSLKKMEEGKPWYYQRKGQVKLLLHLMNIARCIEKGMPYIRSVAIQEANNGKVHSLPCPARHPDVLMWMSKNGIDHRESTQGFIDNTGNFVNRQEALLIAKKANQTLDGRTFHHADLFSEDLW